MGSEEMAAYIIDFCDSLLEYCTEIGGGGRGGEEG